jgi:hypothetical protein
MTPEERKIYNKEWRKNNPEYDKEWKKKNPNTPKSAREKFLKNNPNYWKNRQKESLKNPTDKLKHYLRVYISQTIKEIGTTKKQSTLEIVGLKSWDTLREHIESQWLEGMSWENHGVGKDNTTWHIDHKIPLDSAKSEKDVYDLNHYTNLQPMWGSDNISKRNKL